MFVTVVMKLLFAKLGIRAAMLWFLVGCVLGFQVLFNYTMAVICKANGPQEVKMIEQLRQNLKKR